LNQASLAGNVILVINSLDILLTGLANLKIEPLGVLEPYLKSTKLQIIGLLTQDNFHKIIAPNVALSSLFEKVETLEPKPEELVSLLEQATLVVEKRYKVIFT